MTPVPQVRQDSSGGARLMSGKLINSLIAALRARTPLNAEHATQAGFSGAVKSGGTRPPPLKLGDFDDNKVYVVAPGFLGQFRSGIKARTKMAEQGRTPKTLVADAGGLREIARTLERLTPTEPESEEPQGYRLKAGAGGRVARLRIEWEERHVYATCCCLGVDFETSEFIVQQTTVNNFEDGSYTYKVTASGAIHVWAEGETPAACDEAVIDNGFDPGRDYGSFVSLESSDERMPFSDVTTAAVAALASATPTTLSNEFTWDEVSWRAISTPGGWGGVSLPNVGVSVYDSGSGVFLASTHRWRVTNFGQSYLSITRKLLDATSTVTAEDVFPLAMGEVSDWQPPPTASPDLDGIIYTTLSDPKLGPYR